MSDVSDVPVLRSADVVDGAKGLKSLVVQGHIAPLDGSYDPHHEADMTIARGVAEVLVKTYFGYNWHVESDVSQGIVTFRIPDLMGATLKCVVNLRTTYVNPQLIMRLGGMLLERMNLPRGQVEMAVAKEARKRLLTFDFNDVARKSA